MHNPNGFRTVLYLSFPMFVLLPLSALVFILERISHALLFAHTSWRLRSGDQTISLYAPNGTSTDVTLRINYDPTAAMLGVSVVAFVVSILGVCGIWELRKVEGTASHQRAWTWTTLVANFAVVAVSVAVLGWASALQGQEKGWEAVGDVGKGNKRFTRETWLCSIARLYYNEDWAPPACGIAKATRWTLLPLALSAVGVMLCTWKLTHERGGMKWLVGGKGRYGGFESVYEMSHPAYAPAPAPAQYFQPAPQFHPMSQPYPPVQSQTTPLGAKGGAETEQHAVFR